MSHAENYYPELVLALTTYVCKSGSPRTSKVHDLEVQFIKLFSYFQKFNLNILIYHLGSKTAILKLSLALIHC